MSQQDERKLNHDYFVIDASKNEQGITDFLHSHGIVETCRIHSPKKYWFQVYHYIQLVGETKLKYLYTKGCGRFEHSGSLKEISFEELQRYVLEKINKSTLN